MTKAGSSYGSNRNNVHHYLSLFSYPFTEKPNLPLAILL